MDHLDTDAVKQKFRPRSMRLHEWNYASAGWYFVTICTRDRYPFFGEIDEEGKMNLNPLGKIVEEYWLKIRSLHSSIELDEYMIMPDHLHGILIIDHEYEEKMPRRWQKGSLGVMMNQFKGATTKQIWAMGYKDFAWQRNFYDHVIRNEKDLQRIREYIFSNPEAEAWRDK